MGNPDLIITAPECLKCAESGFTTGSEFFDPMVLPHLAALDEFTSIAWRVHKHEGYFLEVLLAMKGPYEGAFLQFDGPMNEDPKAAIEQALVHVREDD